MSEGLSFGAYRVVRKVGQGGMGAVFLGEHSLIGRRAAIKVLHRDRSSQHESIERFFTEARAASKVEDPGIVQVYDFGITTTGTAYLVMEYLDGESLSTRLRRLRQLAPYDAVRITRQIAKTLAAAHVQGIVHRDLKPENLMMVRDGEASAGERPKILDFGIAKLGDERGERFKTRTGAVMGTPAYMSPEQCNDTGKIDHRTDVYSLGCVLFHLLTGRPPFDADGVGAMIAAHLKEPPPRPSAIAPHVNPVIDPLVARCLAKHPDERFSNMLELQQACDAVLAQLPPEMPTLTGTPVPAIEPRDDATTTLGTSVGESSSKVRPRRLGMWIGVSAAAVAMGIVLAVMTTSRGSSDSPPASTPRSTEPAAEPAKSETVKTELPKPEPAKTEPPKTEPPKTEPPKTEPPKTEPVKTDEPAKTDEPVKTEPEKTEPAKIEPTQKPTTKTTPPRKPVPRKPKPPGSVYDDWD